MEIQKHRTKVLKSIASLPGSRDRYGGPLLVVDATQGNIQQTQASCLDLSAAPTGLSYEELVSLLGYFGEIAESNVVNKGFTLLIDGRKTPPKGLKTVLRACQQALYNKVRQAIIVQPEKFLSQQKVNLDIILEGYDFKTLLVSVHKLSKYIDITQLPEQFGGTFTYVPGIWTQQRERIESVLMKLSTRKQEFLQSHGTPQPINDDEEVFREGPIPVKGDWIEEIPDDLMAEFSLMDKNSDLQATAKIIEKRVEDCKNTAMAPEREAEAQRMTEENIQRNKMLEEHAQGVNRLLDWIEGPGEQWLLTLHEIGESKDEAKQLVKEHKQLAIKSKELLSQADELSELASRLMAAFPAHAITLEKARDQVRVLAQNYNNRVERQSEMVGRSEMFHVLISELTRKSDVLLESLCTDIRVTSLQESETERAAIEEKVQAMEKVYQEVTLNASSFIEDLSASEFNPMGQKISRDYTVAIVHIQEQLNAARERRRRQMTLETFNSTDEFRCLDLVDVRKLKLQQFCQLFTCENDANQAITWIEELRETLRKDYNQIGCDDEELEALKEDRMKLEETARSTYEYGKQLCQVALVLRRSLRINNEPKIGLVDKLENAWGRMIRTLSDHETRQNVSQAFNSTIVEINRRIQELERCAEEVRRQRRPNSERSCAMERRRLAEDISELRHIGHMLAAQINANHSSTVEVRQSAIAAINTKIESLEERHRLLDSMFTEVPSDTERPLAPNNKSDDERTAARIGTIRLSDNESYL